MPRPLDTRLDRVEARSMAAAAEHGSAAIRPTLRAEAAMGAVIRSALARAGVDAAGATRLCFADEAAAPLVTTPDTAELQREDGLLVLPALYERCSGKEMPLGGLHEQDTSVPDFGRVKNKLRWRIDHWRGQVVDRG